MYVLILNWAINQIADATFAYVKAVGFVMMFSAFSIAKMYGANPDNGLN